MDSNLLNIKMVGRGQTDGWRHSLITSLHAYAAKFPDEQQTMRDFVEFVRSSPNCFDRDNVPGHVTAATWLLDPTGTKVLLTHHAKLQKWLQLGGHADGNGNVAEVALIEAREESGIHEITVDSSEIFDIDIHRIPAQPQGVEHLHYDVRFIAFAAKTDTIVSAESIDLAWVPIGELRKYTTEPSMLRMAAKWLQLR